METIFDALPGDIFVLRNAGNTCTHAEGVRHFGRDGDGHWVSELGQATKVKRGQSGERTRRYASY